MSILIPFLHLHYIPASSLSVGQDDPLFDSTFAFSLALICPHNCHWKEFPMLDDIISHLKLIPAPCLLRNSLNSYSIGYSVLRG